MNSTLQVFTNKDFGSVRTVTIDGEPWFIGKDVAEALGYAEPRSAVSKKVEAEDRGVAEMATPSGVQKMTVINESGLYSLILSSKLPSAKKFKRWITAEVIPSIRKHGAYVTNELLDAMAKDPNVMRELVIRLYAEKQETDSKLLQLEDDLNAAMPKAVYYDIFVDPGYATNFRDTAKEFEIPQKCFIDLLLEHKFIYRTLTNELRPHSVALAKGLFILRDYTNPINLHRGTYTLVTAKGKKYIYEYFVKKGIIDNDEGED